MSHVTTATITATIEDLVAAAEEWGVPAALIIIHASPVNMTGYAEGHKADLTSAAHVLQKALGVPSWSDLGAEVKADGSLALHVDGHQFQHIGGEGRVAQDVAVARIVREAKRSNVNVEVVYSTAENGQRVASIRRKATGRDQTPPGCVGSTRTAQMSRTSANPSNPW